MGEVNLLRRYPKSKRNILARSHAKTEEHIRIARQYGFEYFDGPREYGYGGYRYDGRWAPVAEDIIEHFALKPGMRLLDIGCGKGFLVKDLMKILPGLEVFGIDFSKYAVLNSEPEAIGRIHLGDARDLPFPDDSFDCVLSINTVHNFPLDEAVQAIGEIERVCRSKKSYIQVDSYRTPEEREVFLDWVLTAYTHEYPEGWKSIFDKAGFTGDYYYTFIA